MTDRVYPASKPAVNGGAAPAPGIPAAPAKPQLYRPYRPQPAGHNRRRRRYEGPRCSFCCCCFWTVLLVLGLCLLAAIAGAAVYVLYRPHRPEFSVSSLRTATLNLTAAPDGSSTRLITLFNLTLTSKNPNSHFTFAYDSFDVALTSSASNPVFLGNGSLPAFTSNEMAVTPLRAIVSMSSQDLDAESVTSLRSDLKKKNGVPVKIQMDTKVMVSAGKLKSNKVGIRVSCEGFKGVVPPQGKSPSVATVSDSECKVDLRIKIWKLTF
ncbi:NDR1/HIN1-like protein 6 [Eucalyptus grandis]|uniref:NDR1/HIN1-like protein 6 n=1 Tax=Eucalyptus grandis TaxID=71139 RepID=UPI000524B095|nr:NDR1/HIN1-like protein 6 [Eucalyptus grandis]